MAIIVSISLVAFAVYESTKETTKQAETEKPAIKINLPNTQPKMEFVSATEYNFFDNQGGTIMKLLDWLGNGISTNCYEQILYPNKTIYLDWTPMIYQSNYSNYYLNWNVPKTEGIFDQEVRCWISGKNYSIGKGFHVGESNLTTEYYNSAYAESVT
jgi:hypothetical protein